MCSVLPIFHLEMTWNWGLIDMFCQLSPHLNTETVWRVLLVSFYLWRSVRLRHLKIQIELTALSPAAKSWSFIEPLCLVDIKYFWCFRKLRHCSWKLRRVPPQHHWAISITQRWRKNMAAIIIKHSLSFFIS